MRELQAARIELYSLLLHEAVDDSMNVGRAVSEELRVLELKLDVLSRGNTVQMWQCLNHETKLGEVEVLQLKPAARESRFTGPHNPIHILSPQAQRWLCGT